MVVKLSFGQVSAWRLKKQHLSKKGRKSDLSKVVADVCGVQAQVLSAAELGLRARIEGLHQEDVRTALWSDHILLKTWSMRGTLHILPTNDMPLYLAGLRAKLLESKLWLGDNLGVGAQEVDNITDEIGRVLSGGRLSREDLAMEVERRLRLRPEVAKHLRSAWGILLRPAAFQGHLAFGESFGPRATFVNPSKWIDGKGKSLPESPLPEIFLRFVRTYGPASVRDFGHWWGGLRDGDRALLESFAESLEEVTFGEHRGFMTRSDAREAARMEGPKGVILLPSFDGYAMFYHPRDVFVPREHRSKIFRQTAGWNFPAVVVNGEAAGIWSMKKGSSKIAIDLEPFGTFNRNVMSGVREEAADIGEFLGTSVEVRGPP